MEEVVATAERRFSEDRKTADSISVRSDAEMLSTSEYELSQILEDLPGVVGGAATEPTGSFGICTGKQHHT